MNELYKNKNKIAAQVTWTSPKIDLVPDDVRAFGNAGLHLVWHELVSGEGPRYEADVSMGERFRESAEASWLLEAPDTGELLHLLIVSICLFLEQI
jgi:hypothetical protein